MARITKLECANFVSRLNLTRELTSAHEHYYGKLVFAIDAIQREKMTKDIHAEWHKVPSYFLVFTRPRPSVLCSSRIVVSSLRCFTAN